MMKKSKNIVAIIAVLVIPGAIPAIIGYNLVKLVEKVMNKEKK